MAGRRGCRGNSNVAAGCTAEEVRSTSRAAVGEMTMCRHVNPISTGSGCSVEKQLWELNQVLDYQNKILVELLQAVRGQ